MKDEILYISETYKQGNLFIHSIAEKLESIGTDFKIDIHKMFIETGKYKIIVVPINGTNLGCSKSRVKYFLNCSGLYDEKFNRWFFFHECTEEIHSINEIIDIVRC